MRADKVYLVGFMAAGKTSLAREIGRRLDWRIEDVDERIEARERRPIASIFALDGEAYFRAVEREVVQDLLPPRHAVVATGGGTFVDPDLRALIKADGAVFWIDVPLGQIIDRLPRDGSRPLAGNRPQLEGLYESRRLAYAQAHVRLDASRASVGDLADQVVEWLGA
ncbi:MAG: shikimate kinase [Vicinamibacterales bacterium]|jgi:shikimate kinase|nr:shikimate kinase [Vicinamibacterales bacterium]